MSLTVLSQQQSDFVYGLEQCFTYLDRYGGDVSRPFGLDDITAGSETELQAVVSGSRDKVDLPLTIKASRAFANLRKRARSGEAPEKLLSELDEYISDEKHQIWENSWVRFERKRLTRYAEQVLQEDLLADKRHPHLGVRGDVGRFQFVGADNEAWLRLPVSYLIKLALADFLGNQRQIHPDLNQIGASLLDHYLNDNSSPETFSFHVSELSPRNGMGRSLAQETAKRFLFTQLLIRYANLRFGLLDNGQEACVYFAPHTPVAQKNLNSLIPDTFYRQLFMSPCLSGWDRGEEKQAYMGLCHEVLSRSRINAVAKLREAGIITNNLVVLPNLSNTSLANNGVHISLGSKYLTAACRDGSRTAAACEKYLGDLAIKIMEHFLPLFVSTYSAAPYRLGFTDFHPENALGFLAHELDFTHLRMLWRRWKKKADLSLFGHRITPFGPVWLDRLLSQGFRLRGDLVPDFRLLDYPVAFLSSEQSPAYNGRLGNQEQLKTDLTEMGIFDRRMSLYQFFKPREYGVMGFSGFEGRHYSLFPDFEEDLGAAVNLQVLITALAFKYMADTQISHRHIPDTPFVESERRQIFFAGAIGLPTFFVLRKTRNRFLLKILKKTGQIRASRRYPGYLRIHRDEYCRALLKLLREDGAEMIELFGFVSLIDDLERRLDDPEHFSAGPRLIRSMTGQNSRRAISLDADEFNRNAEGYYRRELRRNHMEQALNVLEEDLRLLDQAGDVSRAPFRARLGSIMDGHNVTVFLQACRSDLLQDRLGDQALVRFLNLMLLVEQWDRRTMNDTKQWDPDGIDTPIHRTYERPHL